jgi:VanZ family protein|tara:strand:+ start:756 stop:1139 length:384 start_codon:yes stop_codon:yes gene_type:complete
MEKIQKFLIIGFYLANFILVLFYLYPGSIFGCILYNDCNIQPQITRNFIISSNHFYVFTILSILGILTYNNTKKMKFLILYLLLLSIILELFHLIIPNREFELNDLFGNIMGVICVIIIYKVKDKYV